MTITNRLNSAQTLSVKNRSARLTPDWSIFPVFTTSYITIFKNNKLPVDTKVYIISRYIYIYIYIPIKDEAKIMIISRQHIFQETIFFSLRNPLGFLHR